MYVMDDGRGSEGGMVKEKVLILKEAIKDFCHVKKTPCIG